MTNILHMTAAEQCAALAAISPAEQAAFAAELFETLTPESLEEILDLVHRMIRGEARL